LGGIHYLYIFHLILTYLTCFIFLQIHCDRSFRSSGFLLSAMVFELNMIALILVQEEAIYCPLAAVVSQCIRCIPLLRFIWNAC